jgi:glycosyltransferase involved in cell wall biosynthesis
MGIRGATKIIAVSDNTRHDLSRIMGLDPAEVEVVYWGGDLAAPPMSGDSLPLDMVLGFGGGSARKNTPALIHIFSSVAARHKTAQLVILGVSDAAQRGQLQNLVDKLSLRDRVTLMGYVSDSELDMFYRKAACVAYVSLYEGFGLPVLEAMARGIPVVASNRSSIPEVVGDAGVLVDPNDIDECANAILSLLTNYDRYRMLRQKAFDRAKQFSWRSTAENTIRVFEDALKVVMKNRVN